MLLDTSGLLCLFDEGDFRYETAKTFYFAATERLTHNYVLAEFVSLCYVRGLNRSETLAFVSDLLDNPDVEVIWVDEILHRAAVAFLETRLDKVWSLCDAVSFLLMQQRSITEGLTTDHHFGQAGFIRLLPS